MKDVGKIKSCHSNCPARKLPSIQNQKKTRERTEAMKKKLISKLRKLGERPSMKLKKQEKRLIMNKKS